MGIRALKKCFEKHVSHNISFREFARSDVFPLYEATKNENFNKFLLWDAPKNINEMLEIQDTFMTKNSDNSIMFFSINKKINGEWIGVLKFSPYNNSVEGSFWIHPHYHGSIVIFEALQAVIDIVFSHHEFDCVYSRTKIDNMKIKKFMKKIGFLKVGESVLTHQQGHEVFCDVFKLEKQHWNKNIKIAY